MAQEWAWNVYPSTDISSVFVVVCLAIQVFGVWWGTGNKLEGANAPAGHQSKGSLKAKAKRP